MAYIVRRQTLLRPLITWICLAILISFVKDAIADDHTHRYAPDEEVTVWVNRVGPYHNPQETYDYYSLPFCNPTNGKVIRHKESSLGVALEGDELTDTGIHIKFLHTTLPSEGKLCTMRLNPSQAETLSHAIGEHYWYQMYIDELPVRGMVGEHVHVPGEKEKSFVYTHKEFSIAINGDRIVEVNLTSGNPRLVEPNIDLEMTYSVVWSASDRPFESRFDRYLDFDFFEHKVHWFAMFNSFMTVIFLCGIVALIIVRTVRSDLLRFEEDEEDLEMERVLEETGWHQVRNDVARPPPLFPLLAAGVGAGAQLVTLALGCAIALLAVGTMYEQRGRLMMTVVVVYSLTSVVAGAVSGAYFKRYANPRHPKRWKHTMALSALLVPMMLGSTQIVLNVIGYFYGSIAGVSITHLVYLFIIWLCVHCPLVVLGTVLGRSLVLPSQQRYSATKRPIPTISLFHHPIAIALLGGLLPFAAVYIEVHFIFTSFWSYKFYYVYGFMFLVFLVLLIVTACVGVLCTYTLLNNEDWRWAWTSFGCGVSVGLYVFLYALYFFYYKTSMSGLLQIAYYFAYTSFACLLLGLLAGAVAHLVARAFVSYIYQPKSD